VEPGPGTPWRGAAVGGAAGAARVAMGDTVDGSDVSVGCVGDGRGVGEAGAARAGVGWGGDVTVRPVRLATGRPTSGWAGGRGTATCGWLGGTSEGWVAR
jgi:hypothetical protein